MFRSDIGRKRDRLAMRFAALALGVVLATVAAQPLGAQPQDQKNKKKDADSANLTVSAPLPDSQAVDLLVSQMLGAWQVGDVEMLHKTYADDVVVISAAWEPPLVGWASYAKAYQAQYARSSGGRMDRTNSISKVQGDSAWVTYQWQFTGQMDGNPVNAFGHTTLVLQKRAGAWLIVLNHTSAVPTAPQTPAATK